MQRVISSIISTLLKNLQVRFLVYLDDILIMGFTLELEHAKLILLSSSFLFNLDKCVLTPTKIISYLGVNINLITETFSLSSTFVQKVTKEIIKVKKYYITKRYKQRLAGLLNFAIPILRLPFQFVHLALKHHRKLYKFVNFIHPYEMSYKTFVNNVPIYTDATPSQIGVLSPYDNLLSVFKCNLPILEAEYLGIWIAHCLAPNAIILTDNLPCLSYFEKVASLPPGGIATL